MKSSGLSEEGVSKAASSPKGRFSPKAETEPTGEMSSSSWVADSSGFLSPTGPALKEVMDLVDGVSLLDWKQKAVNDHPTHCDSIACDLHYNMQYSP